MSSAQIFISVNDVIEDQKTAGTDEARWLQAIRDASDFLQKEIGWFIPVKRSRALTGRESAKLFIDPLLSVTSIVNDGTTLVQADYLLQPDGKHWEDGPYSMIQVDPEASNLSAWSCKDGRVVIDGLWGLFLRSNSTGATIATDQSDSAEGLVVSDGGKVAPGMVLLIGTEQELVTGRGDPTTNVTTVTEAVSASDQIITVANGTLVKRGEIIRIDFEQMRVMDISGNNVSVIRNWNNSKAVAHADNAQVDVYRTLTVQRNVNGTTAAAHTATTAISRYTAPDDVQFLTRQIATMMINKAKSGYQGRSGNAETGVVFYNDAFPRYDIDRVAENYAIPRAG